MRRWLAIILSLVLIGSAWANVTFEDTFTRADNADIGADWDAGYGFAALNLVSNAVRPTTLGTDSIESNSTGLANDQYATATIKTLTGALNAAVAVWIRMTAPSTLTGYSCTAETNGSFTAIYKWTAGVPTGVASESSTSWTSGDTMTFSANGDELICYHNGTQLLNGLGGGTSSSGRAGLQLYMHSSGSLANNEIETYEAGDLAVQQNLTLMGVGS